MQLENTIFVIFWSRANFKKAIALLMTMGGQPNLDYYKNLARCVQYIRAMVEISLVLEAKRIS